MELCNLRHLRSYKKDLQTGKRHPRMPVASERRYTITLRPNKTQTPEIPERGGALPSNKAKKSTAAPVHVVAYLFFGVVSTIANVAAYWACDDVLGLGTAISTAAAWLVAVAVAFVTNKAWVFPSPSWDTATLRREVSSFAVCRAATGIMDLTIMVVAVDWLGLPGTPAKLASNVLVVVFNYFTSRLVVFKQG